MLLLLGNNSAVYLFASFECISISELILQFINHKYPGVVRMHAFMNLNLSVFSLPLEILDLCSSMFSLLFEIKTFSKSRKLES